jgi:UDP:flavonoid glycosyltransferase YjiC (YdhE family)
MSDVLFVTWDGGGNVPPALAVGRELRARGHTVRFLGHATQEATVTGAGFEFVRPRHARDFSGVRPHSPLAMIAAFTDPGMGRDLVTAVRGRPADLVVVDCLMFGAMHAAHEAGLRYAVLEHLYDGYYRRGCLGGPLGLSVRLRGLRPRQALDAAGARILTSLPELDPQPSPPANLRQVGPVVSWAPPQRAAQDTVLVSLSTFGFARMTAALQRIVDATRGLDARVVVTTGPAVAPEAISAPDHVEVHRFVPHVELMPGAALVVGHGGHGTTMQALAHDLPLVVMPMDRLTDQPVVGRSLAEAGAARLVRKDEGAESLAPVLAEMLAEGPHRAAAARLGAAIRALPGASLAADAIEQLLGAPRSAAAS